MNAQPLAAEVMPRPAPRTDVGRRAFAVLSASRAALAVLTALFVAVGLVLVLGQFALQDEGMLTQVFARWLTLEPGAVFFFQKVKPVVSAVWALPALAGLEPMLAAHVVAAALAAPMLAAVARTLGIRLPNLAAWILVASPLYLFGAAAGVSNVDGVVATTLFLYLAIAKRRDWWAGLLLGCLPWVRSELAPFALLLWLYLTAGERRRGIALGAMIFPALYALLGALYHRDLLWILHFPPATKFPMPGNPIWEGLADPRELLVTQLLVTPAVGCALAVRPGRLSAVERVLAAAALVTVLLISILPFLHLGNFSPAARYAVQPLPVFALLAARAVESWIDEPRAAWRLLMVTAVLAAIWPLSAAIPTALAVPLLCTYAAVALLAFAGRGMAAAAGVAVIACLGLALPNELATPPSVGPALAWLRDHPSAVRGATIYTNAPEIAFGVEHAPALGHRAVRFVVAPDMAWEVHELSNPGNGQRQVLERIARSELFPPSVPWNEIAPDAIPAPALFVLRDDPRLSLLLPDAVWGGRLEEIARGGGFAVARLVRAGDESGASRG